MTLISGINLDYEYYLRRKSKVMWMVECGRLDPCVTDLRDPGKREVEMFVIFRACLV